MSIHSFTKAQNVNRIGRWVSALQATFPKQVLREFIWVIAGQMLGVLGAMAGVRLLTGVVSPTVYGEIGLCMTLVTLSQQMIFGPISSATLRSFAPALERGNLPVFFRVSDRFFGIAVIAVAGVTLLCEGLLYPLGYGRWMIPVLAIGLFSIAFGYNSVLDSIQNAARQRTVVAWHQAIGQWLRYSLAAGAVVVFGASTSAVMFGYAAGAGIVALSQHIFFKKKLRLPYETHGAAVQSDTSQMARDMWNYGWPFASYAVFTWCQTSSDKWALESFRQTADVGLYQVVYQLGYYPMTLASTLVVQLLAPILFSQAGDGSDSGRLQNARRTINQLTLGSLLLTFVGTAGVYFIRFRVFRFLVGHEYYAALTYLPGMMFAAGIFASAQVATLTLLAAGETRRLVLPKAVTSGCGIVLNCAGAYYWGIPGVVAANAVFASIYLCWVLVLPSSKLQTTARPSMQLADSVKKSL